MVTAGSVRGLSPPFGRVPNGGGTDFAEEPFFWLSDRRNANEV